MFRPVILVIGILIILNYVNVASAMHDYYLESEHPINYDHSSDKWTYSRDWTITMPNDAEHIRLHIVKWSLGDGDRVTIFDSDGKIISKNGNGANGEDYWSCWLPSRDYIKVNLVSKEGEAYGLKIDAIETDADQDTTYQEMSAYHDESANASDSSSISVQTSYSQSSDKSDYSDTYVNPQTTQETIQEPAPMTVTQSTRSSDKPHELTAAGKRAVQKGKKKMPADIQPATPNPPTATATIYTQYTTVTQGEVIPVSYTVTNMITKPTMHCQMILEPPSGVNVEGVQNAEGQGGQFTSVVDVEPGMSNTISARLTSNNAGTYTIRGNATYYYGNDKTTQEENDISTSIQVNPPTPVYTSENKATEATDALTSKLELYCKGLFVLLLVFVVYLHTTKRAPWS